MKPPINCISKSRSFSSGLVHVSRNSQDKANEEPSVTPLIDQVSKLIISVFRRVLILPQEPSQRAESPRRMAVQAGEVSQQLLPAVPFSVSCLYLHNFSLGKMKLRALVAKLPFKKASVLCHHQRRKFYITVGDTILDQQTPQAKNPTYFKGNKVLPRDKN